MQKEKKVNEKEEQKPAAASTESKQENLPEGDGSYTLPPQEKSETEKLSEELTTAKDKYIRLYSEFDNYKKRVARDRAEIVSSASAAVLLNMLSVFDDFERAVKAFGEAEINQPIREGMQLVYNKFKATLQQQGIEEMKTVGQLFDADLHEAIANVPSTDDAMKGKVAEEVQKGYTLNGKVIRFAKVLVAN